ncbi:MAG TPA: hypothetical protein VGC19_11785 [Rhodanobacter sp.]
MRAMTEIPRNVTDPFASTLRTFLDHAQAIASGTVEDDGFSWFLATEYQWEMETACIALTELPVDQVTHAEKAALDKFLADMPAVREALQAFKHNTRNHPDTLVAGEWSDWQDVSALPAWREFSIRTAVLLSQLGKAAQNDGDFFGGH